MKAIRAHEFGGPEVLRYDDMPEPAPGPGQVRVRLHAAGVNPFDTYMLTGTYAIKPPLPYSPGADGAGVVEAVGDGVTGLAVGDRVYTGGTADHQSYGAYRQVVLCTPSQVHPLPARVSFAEGAAVNVPALTAHVALERATPRGGDVVLVHGASGSVGLAAVQMARAAGYTVIGTAGTDDGLALVAAEGAHHVVDHRDAGHIEKLQTLTNGRGPDVILEMLANVNLDHDLTMIAPRGRIVVIGNRGRIEIDPRKIMAKHAVVTGLALWGLTAEEVTRGHEALAAALASGALRPVVGTELPLAEAAEAHRRVMTPGARGKIVLLMP
ncbi:MAG: NADPH:quinone reductase [Acidobacteria bacterium]|nr:NADPH:quinone reductase [Acidobacteriota bacterium]